MNKREKRFIQNEREAFFTSKVLAHYLCKKVVEEFEGDLAKATFLEPSAGRGVLVDSFIEIVSSKTGQSSEEIQKRCTLFEIDTADSKVLRKKYPQATVRNEDFLLHDVQDFYDICIMNPPWGRPRISNADFYERYNEKIRGKCAKTKEKIYNTFFEESNLSAPLEEWRASKKKKYATYKSLFLGCYCFEAYFFKKVLYCLKHRGMAGMLSGDSTLTDSKSTTIREKLYKHLRYVFRFHNELRLFEDVGNCAQYIMSIFGGGTNTQFTLVDNLFHPKTIESCALETKEAPYPGTKNRMGNWELHGHPHRLIKVDETFLKEISVFTGCENPWHSPLPTIHGTPEKELFSKLAVFPKLQETNFSYYRSIDESSAPKKGLITRSPGKRHREEMVLTGPNLFVGNPSNKEPNEGCKTNVDFTLTNLQKIEEDFLPRTVYRLTEEGKNSKEYLKEVPWAKKGDSEEERVHNYRFRVAARRMLATTGARTLSSAIIPPKITHVNAIISISFQKHQQLILTQSLFNSLLLDFVIRSLGSTLFASTINILPTIPLSCSSNPLVQALAARTLRLNCISNHYAPLYKEIMKSWGDGVRAIDLKNLYQNQMKSCFITETLQDSSKPCSYDQLPNKWDASVPLRKFEDREQALCETDALVAILFGIEKETLLNLYQAQFAVLQKNNQDFPKQIPKEGKHHFPRYKVLKAAYEAFKNYQIKHGIEEILTTLHKIS